MTLAGLLSSGIYLSPRCLLAYEWTPPLPRGLCTGYDSVCSSCPGVSETMPVGYRVDFQCITATTMTPVLLRGLHPPRPTIAPGRIVRVLSTRSPTKSRRFRLVQGCRLTVEMPPRLRLAYGTRMRFRTAQTSYWSIHSLHFATASRVLATTPGAEVHGKRPMSHLGSRATSFERYKGNSVYCIKCKTRPFPIPPLI